MGWTGGGTGGGGSPGGATGSVQYNNSGVFGGFGSWDNTNNTLTLSGATGTNPNLILNNVAGARINLQDGYASNYAIYTDTGGGIVLQASPTSGAAIRVLNPSGFTPRIQVATLTDTTARINFGLDGSDNPSLAFGPGNASRDVFLWRDAASGIFAQRNGANPQALRIYNTTDSTITNYERGVIDWQAFANVFSIGTQYGGTGVARDLNFFSGSNNIKFFNGFGHTSHVYTTQHGFEVGYGGTQGTQPNIVFFANNTIAFGGVDSATPTTQTITFQNVSGANTGQTYAPPVYIQAPLSIAQGGSQNIVFTGGFQGMPPAQTATITIGASPGINIPFGSVWPQQCFFFTTTGTLPTGLSPLTTYFSDNGDNPGQNFDASVNYTGGPAISTSGTQSGVHTLHWGGVCTISNASPAVITLVPASGSVNSGHTQCSGTVVQFSANGGTLPTGISANTNYYILTSGITSNSFQVSATLGGPPINTSSAGSGTFTFEVQSSQINQAPFSPYPDGTGLGAWIGPPIQNQSLFSQQGFFESFSFWLSTQWQNSDRRPNGFVLNVTDVSPTTFNWGATIFNVTYSYPSNTAGNCTFALNTQGALQFTGANAQFTFQKPGDSYSRVKFLCSGTADGNGAPFTDSPVLGFGIGTAARDIALQRDAAGVLALFNWGTPTSAASLSVYNTYTNSSNYERGIFDWQTTANTLTIGTQAGGTGTARNVALVAGSSTTTLTAGGGIQVGAPTGGDKGAGTINVAGNFYVNGTVVGGGGGAPGGSATQLQYNNSGAFGGVSGSAVSANGSITLGGATVTANDPVLNLSQTWNASAVTFTGQKFNVTDTASKASSSSGPGSLLFDYQVGGSSVVRLTKEGIFSDGSNSGGFSIQTGAIFTGAWNNGWLGGSNAAFTALGLFLGGSAIGLMLRNDSQVGWAPTLGMGSIDTSLSRDGAAGALALSRTTNATALRVYNTTDSLGAAPTNYERGVFDWTTTTNTLTIGTQKGGTGTARPMILIANGNQMVFGDINGTYGSSVLIGIADLRMTDGGGSNVSQLTSNILTLNNTGSLSWGNAANLHSATSDLFLTRQAAATLQHGAADAAAPVAQTVSYQSVVAGTTNTAGTTATEQLSLSTGTGAAGTKNIASGFAGVSGAATFTVTIATPAVFTLANHGYVPGQVLQFSTTGALPTGLSTATNYYVIAAGLTASAFEVSTTPGGAAVNTSGSQSGTHTSTPQTTAQNPASTVGTWGPSGLTGSQTTSALSVAQVWNTSGVATGFKLNVTNVASGAGSLLVDLQVGGLSAMHVDKAGSTNYISGSIWSWSSSATNAATAGDTGLSRVAAKVVAFGDGAANANGWMQWAGLTRVTATVNFTSTTTLGTVTGLSANVQAGRTYKFVAELAFTCAAAGGIKAAIAGTCTATNIVYDGWILDSGANGVKGNTQATALGTTVASSVLTGTAGHVTIVGTITVNAAGTLLVQAAQNTSSTTATAILRGSTFVLYDIP